MADNVIITSGSGVTIATDDDGSAQHQWVKIEIGANGSFVPVTTANGLPVQILSLPAFAAGSAVAITSLPDLGAASAVRVSSLPAFAVGAITSISNGAILSITNLVLVSGTTIAITSLPDIGLNSSVKVSSLPAFAVGAVTSISNGAILSITNLLLVSGTTIAITSLPDIGLGSSVKVSSLPQFAVGAVVSCSNGQIVSVTGITVDGIKITSLPAFAVNSTVQIAANSNFWSFTSTYTSAQTNVVIKTLSGSTTAYYITDIIFSNAQTHGSFTLLQSKSDVATFTPILDRLYFRDYGGAVLNLNTPIVCATNAAIVFTSRTATDHAVTIIGYTA